MPNIIIRDEMVRRRSATCKTCGARVFIGEYEEVDRGDEILAEWILRHKHKETFSDD